MIFAVFDVLVTAYHRLLSFF